MKSTFLSKEKSTVKFSLEFTAEEFEGAVITAYQENKGKFPIDGFRKGKAPRKLIETHYGEDVFFEDAINDLFSRNYPAALTELKIEAVDRPNVEFDQIEKGKGFSATITVDIFPEIEVKDYKGVEIEKVSAEVSEEDINKEIETLQKRNSRMILVERPAKEGDTVLIDYSGFVGEKQFEGGTAERYPLVLGSNAFIPGFEEQLIGATAGEDKEVIVTFPTEYHSEELAGKEAVFKCKVHEIKEEELPELNDDFAKDVSEFDTLDELKSDKRESMQKAAESRALNEMKNLIVEKVSEANDVDVPNAMVEEEVDNMMRQFDQQLRYQGLDIEKYFAYLQKDPMEFRSELKAEAEKNVKTRIVIVAVANAEKLEASEADINAEFTKMAEQYKMEVEKIKELLGGDSTMLEKDIKMKKAVDFMYDNAVIK